MLVPLGLAVHKKSATQAFGLGWLSGFIANCGILYWLVPTFRAAEAGTLLGILCLALLSAYLALYFAFFSLGLNLFLKYFPNIFMPFAAAGLWTILEILRTHLLTGFPWCLLAYSQSKNLMLIQSASLIGAYGVGFLICLFNIALLCGILFGRKFGIWKWAVCLLPILFALGFGKWRLSQPEPVGDFLKIAILQGNIDQYKKWDEAYAREILETYQKLALEASKEKPDLILWPESALPYSITNPEMKNWLARLVRKTKTYHLVGCDEEIDGKRYNSAVLFNPKGEALDTYRKVHLVPFGEWIPFENLLSRWIKPLNALGGFSKGEPKIIQLADGRKLGVSICFETIFPNLAQKGADLLLNLTNDGWYLDTAAPYQHLAPNVFRAIEQKTPLVRAANTGISCWIDEKGRIQSLLPLNQRGVLTIRVNRGRIKG